MIFKPELVRLILIGRKTQTRRRAPADTDALCRYRPGRAYALERPSRRDEMTDIQRRRLDAGERFRPPRTTIGHIVIEDVRREPAGEITFEDARAEGFRTTADFKAYWVRLYDRTWLKTQPEEIELEQLVERFDARYAEIPVWAIAFHLDPAAAPHLLALRSELGYVDSHYDRTGRRIAVDGTEPEALDEEQLAKVQKRWGPAALERHRAARAAARLDRQLLSVERRLVDAVAAAKLMGIDVSGELRLARDPRAAVRGLRAIERKVDREAA